MQPTTRHSRWRIVGLILLPLAALACTVGLPSLPDLNFGVTPVRSASDQSALPTPTVGPTPTLVALPAGLTEDEALLVNLYARANPSVVNVAVFGQQGDQAAPLGSGSGFVYDDAGHVVTNDHVVEGADQVEVRFADGTVKSADVVGQDPHSDLAVLRLDSLPAGVGPLPLGEMDDLAVGQTVVAIGNPFGLEGTLTRGIISALGRTIPALTPFSIPQAIQTDAAINPGNSGGPLLDLQGRVIGVNAQIETGGTSRSNAGVGFAIPVSIVSRVVPDLIANGRYDWAYLGIQGTSVTPDLVQAMQLPVERGAYIAEAVPGGPADQAGMRGASNTATVDGRPVEVGGDVVTAIDGQTVRSFEDLLIYIALEARPGQTITLTILRDGTSQDLNVTLASRPESLNQ